MLLVLSPASRQTAVEVRRTLLGMDEDLWDLVGHVDRYLAGQGLSASDAVALAAAISRELAEVVARLEAVEASELGGEPQS